MDSSWSLDPVPTDGDLLADPAELRAQADQLRYEGFSNSCLDWALPAAMGCACGLASGALLVYSQLLTAHSFFFWLGWAALGLASGAGSLPVIDRLVYRNYYDRLREAYRSGLLEKALGPQAEDSFPELRQRTGRIRRSRTSPGYQRLLLLGKFVRQCASRIGLRVWPWWLEVWSRLSGTVILGLFFTLQFSNVTTRGDHRQYVPADWALTVFAWFGAHPPAAVVFCLAASLICVAGVALMMVLGGASTAALADSVDELLAQRPAAQPPAATDPDGPEHVYDDVPSGWS